MQRRHEKRRLEAGLERGEVKARDWKVYKVSLCRKGEKVDG